MTSINLERPSRPQGKIQHQYTKHEENLRALDDIAATNSTRKKVWSWSDRHTHRSEHGCPMRGEGKKNARHSGVPGAGPPGGPALGTPAQQYYSTYTTQKHRLTQKTWETHGLGSKPSMGSYREHKEKLVGPSNRAIVTPPPLKGHKKRKVLLPKTQLLNTI